MSPERFNLQEIESGTFFLTDRGLIPVTDKNEENWRRIGAEARVMINLSEEQVAILSMGPDLEKPREIQIISISASLDREGNLETLEKCEFKFKGFENRRYKIDYRASPDNPDLAIPLHLTEARLINGKFYNAPLTKEQEERLMKGMTEGLLKEIKWKELILSYLGYPVNSLEDQSSS